MPTARPLSHRSRAGPRAFGHPLRSTSPGGWCCGRPWPSRPRRSPFRYAPSLRRQVQLGASRAGERSCQAPAPTTRGGLVLKTLAPPPSPLGGGRWLNLGRPSPAPSAVRHCARPATQAPPAAARAGPLRTLALSLRIGWGSPSARYALAVSGVAASQAAPQPLRRPARR